MDPMRSNEWRRITAVAATMLAAGLIVFAPRFISSSPPHPREASASTIATAADAVTTSPVVAPTSIGPSPWPSPSVTESSALVPWADLPPDPAAEPSPLPKPTPDLHLVLCESRQLTARVGEAHDVVAGMQGLDILVQRTSGDDCLLDDRLLKLYGTTRGGNLSFRRPMTAEGAVPQPMELRRPDDEGHIYVEYPTNCDSKGGPAPDLHDVQVLLRNGGGLLAVRSDVDLSFGCVDGDVTAAPVGARPPTSDYPDLGLSAAIDAPATAIAGDLLRYVVRLTNRTTHTITLSPCPNFEQWVKGRYGNADTRQSLNCAAVPTMSPGQQVNYSMEIVVPATMRDDLMLGWTVRTGDVTANAHVLVTAAAH
jgi:hypothetical protein